jgi:3D (Asp-Asp-Asp) domain-containing protein
MKYILLLFVLFFGVSCQSIQPAPQIQPRKSVQVRLTAYWRNSDHWTKRGLTSTGKPLKHMRTCAVDPKVFPYGSTLKLDTNPPLTLAANDTGGAVKSRLASRKAGRYEPIVDIFFESQSQAKRFIKDNEKIVTAFIQ